MGKTAFFLMLLLGVYVFLPSFTYADGTCPSDVNIPRGQTEPSDLEVTPPSITQNFKLVSTKQFAFGGYVRRNFVPSFLPNSWKYVWETTPGAPIVESRYYASPSPSLRPSFLNYNFIEEVFYSTGKKMFVQTQWRTKSGHWHVAIKKPDGTFLIAEEEDVSIIGNAAKKGMLLSAIEVRKCQGGINTLIASYPLTTVLRFRKDYYGQSLDCK